MPVFSVPARIINNEVRNNPVKIHQIALEVNASLSDEVKDILEPECKWAIQALSSSEGRPAKQLLAALGRVELAHLEVARIAATKTEVFEDWVLALSSELRSALETPLNLPQPDWAHRMQVVRGLQAMNQLDRDFSRETHTQPRSHQSKGKNKRAKAS